jgi:trk system potassium uptake protein TrkH
MAAMSAPADSPHTLDRAVRPLESFWRHLSGPQLFVGSFLALVILGTLLLLWLPGIYTGPGLSLVDALFTATSAVCVTGLIVVDTATYFTPLGQAVLLLLIQLGGIGMLTLTTFIILLLGGRLTLRAETVLAPADAALHFSVRRLIDAVFRYTFAIEGAIALGLWLLWSPRLGPVDAFFHALFHAVSAFCNAGFSTFSAGLVPVAGDIPALLLISVAIVLGGLGFVVLEELWLHLRHRTRTRLSLHSRLVLVSSAVLVLAGAALFFLLEWGNVLAPFPWFIRPFEALFLSITPRTAGFNTVDYAALSSAALFLTIGLMMVGGSPGSTAGGLKTTTLAVLAALAVARLRGRTRTDAFGRTIPEGTVQRAAGLVVLVMALLGAAILLLQVSELAGTPHSASRGAFMELTFEAVSAFNTVGLSTGITPSLSTPGKLILAVLMFAGRVGPFTLVASMAAAAARRRLPLRFASEDVIVG